MTEPLVSLERLNEPAEEPRVIRFFAAGVPATKGNMRAFNVGGTARITEKRTRGLDVWLHALSDEGRRAMDGQPPMDGPLWLSATFWLPKPASAPKRKRTWPINMRSGDWDKLGRAFDALTGVVWHDDAQIVDARVRKRWETENPSGGNPGVTVRVGEVRE